MENDKFIEFLENEIARSFLFEDNKFAQKKTRDIMSYIQNKAQDDPSITQAAKENGFNAGTVTGGLNSAEYNDEFNSLNSEQRLTSQQKELNDWVKKYLPVLRRCYNGKMFLGREKGTFTGPSDLPFDKLDAMTKANVLLLRSFLDRESLSFLYRDAPKVAEYSKLYNIDIENVDCNTPVEDINLDFSKISDKEAMEYYGGTRVRKLNKLLKDSGALDQSYGDKKTVSKKSDVWKNGGLDVVRTEKAKSVVEKYVRSVYGMDFSIGKDGKLFSFGNKKIPKDTLIINFSAALNCPAWNECLLKDVCYARGTEKRYINTYQRNQRSNIIWLQTQTDSNLMSMLLELVRSYIVNYTNLSEQIKSKNSTLFEAICNEVKTKDNLPDELSKMSFSEIREKYGEEIIQYIKDNKVNKCRNIRLNEDGDFIGQWLVDAWDDWAGDFKIIDVSVTAYTCRALNYEKVKNLILNVSKDMIVSKNTDETTSVSHYFCAVTPETYNAFGETYGGREDFGLDLSLNNGIIKPVYRSLRDENGYTAAYYYKCPCGRGEYSYVEEKNSEKILKSGKFETVTEMEFKNPTEDSPNYASVDGTVVYKKVKSKNKNQYADCYRCRICYGRSSEGEIETEDGSPINKELPVYVFVSAHGVSKGLFTDQTKIKGRPVKEWLRLQNQEHISAEPATVGAQMNESIDSVEESDPLAIKIITKNAIKSVANMMRQKISSINEQYEKYNDVLKKLN